MIIVEGPDGAGKSTLVKEIIEIFPFLAEGERGVSDRDKLWEVTRPDTYRALAECLTTQSPHIWDRLFWSEFAYWEVTGRPSPQFTPDDRAVIPHVIKALRAPVIFCMPPYEEVLRNVEQSKQMEGVAARIEDIYRCYEGMLLDYQLIVPGTNIMTYDYTSIHARDRRHEMMGRISAYLEARSVDPPGFEVKKVES